MIVETSAAVPPLRASFARAPGGHWLWGHGPAFASRPLALLEELSLLGDGVSALMGPVSCYVVNHPELVRQVMQSHRVYNKQTLSYVRLRQILGLGLITSDGDYWLRQRRIAQPAFHRQKIA